MRLVLCFVLLSVMVLPVAGQSWRNSYNQAQNLYNQNNLEEAYQAADQALKQYLAENGAADAQYASLLRLLSVITYTQDKFSAGIEFAQKEIQIRVQKKDTLYAGALTILSQFQKELGQYDQAIISLLESKQVLQQYYSDTDGPVVDCTVALGINYYLNNDFQEAERNLAPALQTAEKNNAYSEDVLEAYYYYGLLELEAGNAKEALKTFIKARDLYESSELKNTINYPLVVYGLAKAYNLNSAYPLAEESYQQAQAVYEKLAGRNGDDYFRILNERAVNLQRLGKQNESEALFNQIRSDPNAKSVYALSLGDNAALLQAQGDYSKAEKLYLEALAYYNQDTKESQLSKAEMNENLAMLYSEKDDQDRALSRLSDSRAVLEKLLGTTNRKYVAVLNKIGWVLTKKGNLTEAATTYNEVFQIINGMKVKPASELLAATEGLAEVEWKKGSFAKSDSMYESVIANYNTATKDSYYLVALNGLAASKQAQGQFSAVLDLLKKALAATGSVQGLSGPAYGAVLESMALLNIRLGNLTSAKTEIDSVLLIYEKTVGRQSPEYANALLSLGRYHQVTGDYTAAEPYFKSARDILKIKKGEQSTDYAAALNSLALLYQTMGNYADAQPLLQESKMIYETRYGKMNAEYSTALQNLATLYQLEGKYDQAEPLMKQALAIDKQTLGENHPQYGITLQNLATLYQKLGRQAEAQEMLEKVLLSTERNLGKNHPSYATTLTNLAALYQDKGNFALAEATWQQSVQLRKHILGEDHPDYARSLYGLAGVYHALGQLDKAKEYYEPVIAKYQKQVKEFFPSLSEKEKSAFYAKIKPVFDAYQDFCVQYLTFKPQESGASLQKLYDLQLSTKAILLNATNKVRSRIQQSGNAKLQESFKEWLALKENIVRYYNYSQAERDKSTIDLASLESKANDLEKQLSTESDAFRSQFEKETITWKEVRNALQQNEAAVEIIRIKKKYAKDSIYYVGLILRKTDENPSLIIWPQGQQLETRRFKYHRNTIKFHYTDTLSYAYFWAPLESKLNGMATVFLSCDGVFNKVNFNSLFNPSTHHFVIDDFTLRQVSNTRELAERRPPGQSSGRVAALFGFADFNLGEVNTVASSAKRNSGKAYGFKGEDIPVLPATEKEVDDVQKLLVTNSWDVHNYKKMEATEENIKKVESPKVLHIATHGFFLSDIDLQDNETDELSANPLFRSGVLLAGASADRVASSSQEDGVLTAYEAMNLSLDQTELVVLSACETGLGEVRNGEGVYGLQRSFLVAGANTVLMSLWQVDDVATQELMNAFYSIWVKGTDKHDAFRKAQLEMKQKYTVPFFWGAFVLIGY